MIETNKGTRIKFVRLDEWVAKMTVSIPYGKGRKVVTSPKIAIDCLRAELALLEQASY